MPIGWLWMITARAGVPVASSSAALPRFGPVADMVTVGGSLSKSMATSCGFWGFARSATTVPGVMSACNARMGTP